MGSAEIDAEFRDAGMQNVLFYFLLIFSLIFQFIFQFIFDGLYFHGLCLQK